MIILNEKTIGKQMKQLTEQQRWRICDYCSDPIPLKEADLSVPFVYDREYGFFYVPFGYHQQVMANLQAFKNSYDDAYDYMDVHEIGDLYCVADAWLKDNEGVAFRSSVGNHIYTGDRTTLNHAEKRIFGVDNLYYMFVENNND